MKQFLSILFAIALIPAGQSYAWIGGPFSNNTYFGENGDDGVYEAIAIPMNPVLNGIGIYRWGVANSYPGVAAGSLSTITTNNFGDYTIGTSGNVQLSGVGNASHSWFFEGVGYRGHSEGIVNSALGIISVTGQAEFNAATINSGFRAQFDNGGEGIPVRRFEGVGTATTNGAAGQQFDIFVFGSKVSNEIIIFGAQQQQP